MENNILVRYISNIGAITMLGWDAIRKLFKKPFEFRLLLIQMEHLGVNSLSIVCITAFFTGMVLALQTAYALAEFGAKLYIGEIVSLSLVRELGPVLTSLMVGGRVGAGITAEIGSMKVTEQVDAMRALGADPIKKLVLPKVMAIVIMLPLLTVLSDFLGIMGGLLVSTFELKISSSVYISHVLSSLQLSDIMSGLFKTVFFAFFISIVGCYNGLNARGGADGVGKATTSTVVIASIMVLISNFFLTKLFFLLFE